MKWIKASERLPQPSPPNEMLYIRYNEGREKETGEKNLIIDLIENGWIDVEWLDESDQPAPEEEWDEENEKASLVNILYSLSTESGSIKLNTDECELLADAIYDDKLLPLQSQLQSLTAEVIRLTEQLEKERICFRGYITAAKAQRTSEPAIMSSAFKFDNGRRIICYTSYENGIKSFECDENWKSHLQPFAEIPFPVDHYKTMANYHLIIRSQHKPEDFVPEHSTTLDDQLFTQSKSTQ